MAGAALLAGAHARLSAAAQPDPSDDIAFAVPRFEPSSGNDVALPRPLSSGDARRIRRIFQLQAAGQIPAAIAETAQLTDNLLLGHILADRYLCPEWHGSVAELTAWQAAYPDLPEAADLYARQTAMAGANPDGMAPPSPTRPLALPAPDDAPGVTRVAMIDRAVRDHARAGQFDAALRVITRTKGLAAGYASVLRAELAQAQFFANRDAEALGTADSAFRSGGHPALAAYIAGLAAWRLDRFDLAHSWMEAAWRAPDADASMRASAAYWAARAHRKTGQTGSSLLWVQRAAREPGTLYGQIARHVLGYSTARPEPAARMTLGLADIALLDGIPAGHRAFALLQVGESDRAERELRRLWGEARDLPGLGRAIVLVAQQAGLTAFATALDTVIQDASGRGALGTLPLPKLKPQGGFRIDPALLYGITRVESNFDATAVSPVGATGLMQLMPVTATFFAGDGRPVAPATVQRLLHDPAANLNLGQRYVLFLADALDGDLLRVLAAYNTGLSGMNHWSADVRAKGDPLMFIESIPVTETRAYVAKALTFTWMYAARLGLDAPSLNDLAADTWPQFTALPGRKEPAPRLH